MKIINSIPPQKDKPVALDIEVFGQEDRKLHRPTGYFACISVCYVGESTVYQLYDTDQLNDLYKQLRKSSPWIFHNALYDIRQLRRWSDFPYVDLWDTMIMERDLFGGYYDTFGLSSVVRRWLGKYMEKETRDHFSSSTTMDAQMKTYAALDSLYTAQVYEKQRDFIQEDEVDITCYNIDKEAIWAILDMQPVRVDVDRWLSQAKIFEAEGNRLEQDVLKFNSKSAVQVKKEINKLLPKKEQITSTNRTETLDPFLTTKRDQYPKVAELIETIIKARRYRDASSRFGTKWIESYVEDGGMVFPNWNITGAGTGRMSCSDPNLQQIPAREMPIYREFFIPRDGNKIMVSDVSQQEPRILAWFSQDARLIEAITNEEDLHLTVARAVFHDETLTKQSPKRHIGKAINLGSSYGLTSFGLARNLGISDTEAEEFLRKYFERFRGIAGWQQKQRRQGYALGYVTTATGRRVWVNTYSGDWANVTINAPIQGTAADHTKLALSLLHKRCREEGLPFAVTMLIHDEHVQDFPAGMEKKYRELAEWSFIESGKRLVPGIPMKVNIEIGDNWGVK